VILEQILSGSSGSTFSANHYSMGKDIANGSWSHPHYSDLIIGYHTGIRIGGTYSGVRFYANSPTTDANNDGNGDGGEALLMTVGGYVGTANSTDVYVNNNLFAGSSMRAPIYYDSNDTGYYVNPNSSSVFSDVRINDGNVQLRSSNVARNTKWRALEGTTDVGISLYNNQDTWCMQLYANAGTEYGFLNGNWGGWDIRKVPSGNLFLNNQGTYYLNGSEIFYNRVYGNTDIRSPIFYDYDNTAYYGDFASTGDTALRVRGGALFGPNTTWGTYLLVGGDGRQNYTNSTTTASVCSTDGNLHIDSASGKETYINWYDGDQFRVGAGNSSGTALRVFGSSNYTEIYGSTRSPIFYDLEDTGYYTDPNSVSYLNNLIVNGGAISNNNTGLRNVMPTGGSYVAGASSVAGAIVITLPVTVYPMLKFRVSVYTYDGLSFDIYCGGHTSGGFWYNTFAYMGTQNRNPLNVRFTYGGGSMYVYIGEIGQSWSYPQVFITDVQVGYTNYEYSNWDNGWTIGFNSSTYNNVSSTHVVNPPAQSSNNSNPLYGSIFYDANDTAYYTDPHSTSRLNRVDFTNLYLASNNAYGFLGSQVFCDTLDSGVAGDQLELNYSRGTYVSISHDSMRAPLFYDVNDTAYYTDPASTSVMNRISTVRTDNWLYIDNNYGHSVVGLYNSTIFQGVFAMGDSYKLTAGGAISGLYGIAWSHPNAGGIAGNLDSHGLIVAINGGYGSSMSYSIKASGNVTAYSDERLKTNWRDMPDNFVAKLSKVKVGIYDRIDGEKLTQVGVSAQSLQAVLPEAIITADDEISTLSISYGNAALASAIELAKEIVTLKEKAALQDARINNLEKLIAKLIELE